MTNRPQDNQATERAVPESGPAVDSIRTKQEAEAVAAKRQAEAKLAKASRREEGGSRPASDSPKRHGDKLANTDRNAAGEPVIEDEP